MSKTYIYGLCDPNTEKIRYIGKSDNPKVRYANHLHCAVSDTNEHKKNWIRSLQKVGQVPSLVILEEIEAADWEERERWWIQYGRDNEWGLTNMSDGGLSRHSTAPMSLIGILSLHLPEDVKIRLQAVEYELLASITLEAVQVALPYLQDFFDGVDNSEEGFTKTRQLIMQRLAEAG